MLEAVVGCLVVILVLSDIFRSILLPRPTHRALRLGPLLGLAVVPLWLRLTAQIRSRDARQTLRASLGPLLLVLSLLIWVTLLNLGFALVLHAVRDGLQPPGTFLDAVYQVSVSFLTLGPQGVTAEGAARAVFLAAGLSGLAIVTIMASYLLTIQGALHRREVLVLSTTTAAGRPPTGEKLLETYARAGLDDAIAGLFRAWEEWAADVLHSHRANPALLHFRSTDEDGEWLATLGAVLDAAALLLAAADERDVAQAQAAARILLPMGARTITALAGLIAVETNIRDPEASRAALATTRHRLDSAGFRLVSDEDRALERLRQLRRDYYPCLRRLCDRLGYVLPHEVDESSPALADETIAETAGKA